VIDKEVSVNIIEVAYDVEKTAKAIEQSEMLPNDFAQMLRKG